MDKEGKIVTILLWVLLLISAVLIVSLMANIGEDTDPTMGSWINTNLIWAYILLVVGAGIAIIFALYHMVTDIKAAKGGLIALVFLGAVTLVSYLISTDAIPQFLGVQRFINDGTLTPTISRWIDTGLHATYILLGLAVLSIVYSSVSRLFK